MCTKPIDRLLFEQGGLCFFCNKPIPPGEATVEHLVASANGGPNHDENCVACCRRLNQWLGSKSLKEKLRILLNQKGAFRCPNGNGHTSNGKVSSPIRSTTPPDVHHDRIQAVLNDLHKRGTTRPGSLKTLSNTIAALFKKTLSPDEVGKIVAALLAKGVVAVDGTKLTYNLPKAGV